MLHQKLRRTSKTWRSFWYVAFVSREVENIIPPILAYLQNQESPNTSLIDLIEHISETKGGIFQEVGDCCFC